MATGHMNDPKQAKYCNKQNISSLVQNISTFSFVKKSIFRASNNIPKTPNKNLSASLSSRPLRLEVDQLDAGPCFFYFFLYICFGWFLRQF